ncbi:hypothetical protein [Estrella lausannensis]|uniref:Uncharacterized protein n=1 Tax=Estrella lausannensis TaxID=483423 RepID=A0A0H5E4H1_9BACT|nr:hypothetical protein [Estrella lausannensis]CRX38105.1 hypothetical protein ELAC_0753 [Estrella lausannensis]
MFPNRKKPNKITYIFNIMSYTQAISYQTNTHSSYKSDSFSSQTIQFVETAAEEDAAPSVTESHSQVYTSYQSRLSPDSYAEYLRFALMEQTAKREKEWAKLPITFESLRLWDLFIQTLPLSLDCQLSLMTLIKELKQDCEEHRTCWSKKRDVELRAQDCFKEKLLSAGMKASPLRKLLREVHVTCMILLLDKNEMKTLSETHDLLFLRTGVEELLLSLNSETSKEALKKIQQTRHYDGKVIANNLWVAKKILMQEGYNLPESVRKLLLAISTEQSESFEVVIHQLEKWGSILYDVYYRERFNEHLNTSFFSEDEGILKATWNR